jgi:short-subunit dehydrogenase
MRRLASPLKHRLVVITGASSGIGRAAALAFARRGANVVLAARREGSLHELANECRSYGVQTLVVPTDVSDSTAVSRLARLAYEALGDIDVWINNAGVGLLGPFVSADIATQRRVLEINLHGTMHGAAAVLPYFLRQRRGVMITNISVGGLVPVPYAAAYTASKFGIRGFMSSLRQELKNYPNVHLCSVFPACIDTPGYQHGGNVSGSALRPAGPIFSPEAVAEAMVSLSLRPRSEVTVGWTADVAKLAYRAAPVMTEHVMGLAMRRYLQNSPPAPRTAGNLYEPVLTGTGASGGWRLETTRTSFLSGFFSALALAGGALLLSQRTRKRETERELATA